MAAYRAVFGCAPPREFLEAYESLAESLYWGSGKPEVAGVRRKGGNDWFFADWRLLRIKARADKHLAQTARALRRYARRREAQGGPPAPDPRGRDLDRDGEARRSA